MQRLTEDVLDLVAGGYLTESQAAELLSEAYGRELLARLKRFATHPAWGQLWRIVATLAVELGAGLVTVLGTMVAFAGFSKMGYGQKTPVGEVGVLAAGTLTTVVGITMTAARLERIWGVMTALPGPVVDLFWALAGPKEKKAAEDLGRKASEVTTQVEA